jgi:hypothetical protein
VKKMQFELTGGQILEFDVKRMINGGFSGRNQEAVWAHIEELEKIGVKRPEKTPTFYPIPAANISQADQIEVIGEGNSTEIEYVMLLAPDGMYIALGGDHTDRELETVSIPKSKLVYPNIVSRKAWKYEDIKDHWDRIEIRCWLGENRQTLYQEGTLAKIMPPAELLEHVQALVSEDLKGSVILSGTLAALTEGIAYSPVVEGELFDPVTGERISLKYRVKPITWFKE